MHGSEQSPCNCSMQPFTLFSLAAALHILRAPAQQRLQPLNLGQHAGAAQSRYAQQSIASEGCLSRPGCMEASALHTAPPYCQAAAWCLYAWPKRDRKQSSTACSMLMVVMECCSMYIGTTTCRWPACDARPHVSWDMISMAPTLSMHQGVRTSAA